jgi:hypothetical protein
VANPCRSPTLPQFKVFKWMSQTKNTRRLEFGSHGRLKIFEIYFDMQSTVKTMLQSLQVIGASRTLERLTTESPCKIARGVLVRDPYIGRDFEVLFA